MHLQSWSYLCHEGWRYLFYTSPFQVPSLQMTVRHLIFCICVRSTMQTPDIDMIRWRKHVDTRGPRVFMVRIGVVNSSRKIQTKPNCWTSETKPCRMWFCPVRFHGSNSIFPNCLFIPTRITLKQALSFYLESENEYYVS